MLNRSGRRLAAGITVAGLLLAACGGDDDSSDSAPATDASPATTEVSEPADEPSDEPSEDPADEPSDEPSEEPADEPSEEPADEPAEAPAPSGEVVFGWPSDAGQNYDPHATASIAVGSYLAPVFDSLVAVAPDGSISPSLATSFEFSDDDSTLTLTLRDDVVFHDGTPFDAEAVKANIERGQTLETSAVKEQLANIASVTVVDPTTVELALTGGAGTILPLLGGQAGMMVSPAAFGNDDLATHPIGTGPWAVSDESVPGSEMIFEAFADYWDPSVQGIERFIVRIAAPDAQAPGMLDGSLDLLLLTSNPQDAPTLEDAGNSIQPTGMEYVHHLFLSKDGVFADEHARLAVTHAIDRQLLADTVLLGQCAVEAQPFKPTSWAYNSDLAAPAPDPARVQDELVAAGMPDGFEFTAVVSAAGTFLPSIAQAIQGMLAEYGITMNVEPLPPAQVLQTYAEGNAQAYYSTQSGGADPSVVIARLMTSLSPGGGVPDELAALAEQGSETSDVGERQSIYHDWAAVYQETAFHVGVCNQDILAATAPGVSVPNFRDPLTVDPRGITVEG
jgi:peptide/nickel transport system substrate-binding protein